MRTRVGPWSLAGAALLALILAPAQAAAQGGGGRPFSEEAVAEAADRWLALVDAGEYGASWKLASQAFRDGVGRQQWAQRARSIRDNVGSLRGRRLVSARYARELPGSGPGEYVVLLYESRFTQYSVATERVILTKTSAGSWKVAGYFVH